MDKNDILKVRFAILGAFGRMGTAIRSIVKENPFITLGNNKYELVLDYLLTKSKTQQDSKTGKNYILTGMYKSDKENSYTDYFPKVYDIPQELKYKFPKKSNYMNYFYDKIENVYNEVDVFIDFSTAQVTMDALEINKKHKKAFVIGTTGFTDSENEKIKEYSKIFPILIAPNFSIGVNALFSILEKASKMLSRSKGFQLDISETHHRHKKDFPSGTALKLLEIASLNAGYGEDYLDNMYQNANIKKDMSKWEFKLYDQQLDLCVKFLEKHFEESNPNDIKKELVQLSKKMDVKSQDEWDGILKNYFKKFEGNNIDKDYLKDTYDNFNKLFKVYLKNFEFIATRRNEHIRQDNEIGFSFQRRSQIVGEHEVVFSSDIEEVKLSHKAFDRKSFAKGSLFAACFLYKQKPGLYNMQDII